MSSVLLLTDGPSARDALLEALEPTTALLTLGERIVVVQDDNLIAADAAGRSGVIAAADDRGVAEVMEQLDALIDDRGSAITAVGQLLGVDPATVDDEVVSGVLGWLTALSPAFTTASPPGDGEPWAFGALCAADEGQPPAAPAAGSPLRSVRFAGDPVLEQCVLGSHRMMAPEQGRAVVRVQAALLDLGFALPTHGADGIFGQETGQAVSAFKRANGIEPSDPVIGRATMARLDELFF
jgi:Putative peptidoglycan binding domain